MNNLREISKAKMTQYAYFYEKIETKYIITIIEHNDALKYCEVWVNQYDEGNAYHVIGINAKECPKKMDYKAVLLNAAIEYIERDSEMEI